MENNSSEDGPTPSGGSSDSGRRPARNVQAGGQALFKLAGAIDYASDFGVGRSTLEDALRTGALAAGYVEDLDEWIIDYEHLHAWVMKQSL